MSNIGKKIQDFYCNGFFGRDYDLFEAVIEAEGFDWLVVRKTNGKPQYAEFEGASLRLKQKYIDYWCGDSVIEPFNLIS